ncbi:hypothetical protein M422DRAFT_153350 [Sphaerobolus stellatus SS14]|nr:hypothetical protein M422DRAFT_153350 [Sphaerobolus stellatus SS14]
MERRRVGQKRPAPSEEVQCWQNICATLNHLRSLANNVATTDVITRVNRIISTLPPGDDVPENQEALRHSHKKLLNGISEIREAAEKEVKSINEALEQVGILLALRQAPDVNHQGILFLCAHYLIYSLSAEKRMKRQRMSSPSSVPSTPNRMATPPATSAAQPRTAQNGIPLQPQLPFSRDPKARREALARQLPLQPGRKVAFHQPPAKPGTAKVDGADGDGETWILAVVKKCINQDKNRSWNTTLRNLIPLPDPNAPPNSAMHPNSYEEYLVGSIVMGLYPDTSCFYRAEVVASPGMRSGAPSKNPGMYRLKFEDDDDQVRVVAAHLVVEWPGV